MSELRQDLSEKYNSAVCTSVGFIVSSFC